MIHLKLYNESADQLCRQVTKEEMETIMGGQKADAFTKAESQKVIDTLVSYGLPVAVEENEVALTTLYSDLFRTTYLYPEAFPPERKLRDRRAGKSVSPNGDKGFGWTFIDNQYPRVMANNIHISMYQGSGFLDADIYKSADDWVFVCLSGFDSKSRPTPRFYVCDGFQGLLLVLSDSFGVLKNKKRK
jgi:hypothetical protein